MSIHSHVYQTDVQHIRMLHTHTDPQDPFSVFTKWQWFLLKNNGSIRLCSLFVALFTHRWSSDWTRFKRRGSSSIQKYSTAIFLSQQTFIPVHQWPSHISSHSDKKKKKKQKHNLLHKAKRKGGVDHIRGLQVLTHSKQIVYFASQQSTL